MRHQWPQGEISLARIFDKLVEIDERTEQIMSTLAEVLAEDAALNDEITQVVQLVKDDAALIASLQGAIGSGNLSPEQQANVDNLFAQLSAQHDTIAAALTPTAPVEGSPAEEAAETPEAETVEDAPPA